MMTKKTSATCQHLTLKVFPGVAPSAEVNCGGHQAQACADCTQVIDFKTNNSALWISWWINHWRYQLSWLQGGQGKGWCNGDCVWSDGQCISGVYQCISGVSQIFTLHTLLLFRLACFSLFFIHLYTSLNQLFNSTVLKITVRGTMVRSNVCNSWCTAKGNSIKDRFHNVISEALPWFATKITSRQNNITQYCGVKFTYLFQNVSWYFDWRIHLIETEYLVFWMV